MNILVTGGKGQLGKAISISNKNGMDRYFFVSHSDLDITNSYMVEGYIVKNKIDIIVNCAAYTDLTKCELYHRECNKINYIAVKQLLDICERHNIFLIHISTDFVYKDNIKPQAYEYSDTEPLTIYGKAKLNADTYIQGYGYKNYIILRPSWIYSTLTDNNFFMKLCNNQNNIINVVNNEYGTPTYAPFIAEIIIHLIESGKLDNLKNNIYNCCPSGVTSRYEYAKYFMNKLYPEKMINPIIINNPDIKRPEYVYMNCDKLFNQINIIQHPWTYYLDLCCQEYK